MSISVDRCADKKRLSGIATPTAGWARRRGAPSPSAISAGGTVYVMVRGYAATSIFTLKGNYD
jgi:hypothetical protein